MYSFSNNSIIRVQNLTQKRNSLETKILTDIIKIIFFQRQYSKYKD